MKKGIKSKENVDINKNLYELVRIPCWVEKKMY